MPALFYVCCIYSILHVKLFSYLKVIYWNTRKRSGDHAIIVYTVILYDSLVFLVRLICLSIKRNFNFLINERFLLRMDMNSKLVDLSVSHLQRRIYQYHLSAEDKLAFDLQFSQFLFGYISIFCAAILNVDGNIRFC